jgi:hypothetical protein
MVGAYERPLSFTTMTSGFLAAAMLFSASQHAAGERAVADDRDHAPRLTLIANARPAVGVGARSRRGSSRRVASLSAWFVAGQPTAGASSNPPAGRYHLV